MKKLPGNMGMEHRHEHGQEAGTCSMDMERGHAAWVCSMNTQHDMRVQTHILLSVLLQAESRGEVQLPMANRYTSYTVVYFLFSSKICIHIN
jgi:hypothetical protein